MNASVTKVTLSLCLLSAFFLNSLQAQQTSFEFDYFGQVPPDTAVIEFRLPDQVRNGFDFINSLSFAPSGKSIICGLTDREWSTSTIVFSTCRNRVWTALDTLPYCRSGINSNPVFLNDSVVYFSSRFNKELEQTSDFDIFTTTLSDRGWTLPEKVKDLSEDTCREFIGTFSLSGDVYFTRLENLGQPVSDLPLNNELYCGEYANGRFRSVRNMGIPINTVYGEFCAYADPHGSFLLFGSNRPGGYGKVDTYISFHSGDGTWSAPVNLGSRINTAEIDSDAVITPDGKYMFFIRRQGWNCEVPNRIYWVSTAILDKFKPE
ncbi:MAG: hypothetical protein ACOYXB_16935 [Bacteroidota bacterium]